MGEPVGFAQDYSLLVEDCSGVGDSGAGIVLGLRHRQTMLDPHRHTRNKHWERLLDLQIMRRKLRIVLWLEIRRAGIVLGLGNRRSMLDPHRHTRNKHWKSLLNLRRNMHRWVRNELSLGNRRGWRILLSLGIQEGSRYVLGWPWSILDNWATVRYSCCNSPLTLSWSIEW